MINYFLNGKKKICDEGCDLSDAIKTWDLIANTFAIAINSTFIPRAEYESTIIKENDRIEIVSAMQGG